MANSDGMARTTLAVITKDGNESALLGDGFSEVDETTGSKIVTIDGVKCRILEYSIADSTKAFNHHPAAVLIHSSVGELSDEIQKGLERFRGDRQIPITCADKVTPEHIPKEHIPKENPSQTFRSRMWTKVKAMTSGPRAAATQERDSTFLIHGENLEALKSTTGYRDERNATALAGTLDVRQYHIQERANYPGEYILVYMKEDGRLQGEQIRNDLTIEGKSIEQFLTENNLVSFDDRSFGSGEVVYADISELAGYKLNRQEWDRATAERELTEPGDYCTRPSSLADRFVLSFCGNDGKVGHYLFNEKTELMSDSANSEFYGKGLQEVLESLKAGLGQSSAPGRR